MQVLNHMIKGICGSAMAYTCLIRDEGVHPQCIHWATSAAEALSTAIEWTHRRQVLVSLADGTYMSQRTPIEVNSFLRQKLNDGDVVQALDTTSCLFHTRFARRFHNPGHFHNAAGAKRGGCPCGAHE